MLVLLLFALLATPAAAQCDGDFDTDGRVAVSELVTAVTNALDGCPSTPTRCPYDLTAPNNGETVCAWRGYYADCGEPITITLTSSGLLRLGRTSGEPLGLSFVVDQDGDVTLLHDNRGFDEVVNGSAFVDPATGNLVIVGITTQTSITDGCTFREFDGAFLGVVHR